MKEIFRTFIFFILFFGFVTESYSQQKKFKNYPDSKDSLIFDSLILSENTSWYSSVKINFKNLNEKYFLITNKAGLFKFYKWKYKSEYLNTAANKRRLILLFIEDLPIRDTLFFTLPDIMQNREYKLYPDSTMNEYRQMGLQNVFEELINHNVCFCADWPDKLLAYLFDKRILIEMEINESILRNIYNKYHFGWDNKEYQWYFFN